MNNALTNAPGNGGRNSGWKLPLKIFTAIFEPTSKAPLKGLRNPDTYFYQLYIRIADRFLQLRKDRPYKFNNVRIFMVSWISFIIG